MIPIQPGPQDAAEMMPDGTFCRFCLSNIPPTPGALSAHAFSPDHLDIYADYRSRWLAAARERRQLLNHHGAGTPA